MSDNWYLYVIRCGDDTLYTGITTDLEKRFRMHSAGKGAKYTRGRGPLKLVYNESGLNHSTALRKEYAFKQLSREEKETVIRQFAKENHRMKKYRFAEREDVPVILDFIKGLAAYENMQDQVVATEELLERWLFEKKSAEVIFALDDGKPVGFALFFQNFSTFLGRAGIYLEDLFVFPEYRGKGYGKGLLETLGKIANERECGRLEWSCLDWNQPSIDFYRSMGAVPMDEWTVYRISGDTLQNMR